MCVARFSVSGATRHDGAQARNDEEGDGKAAEASDGDDRDLPGSPVHEALAAAPPPASASGLVGALLGAAYEPARPGRGDCRHATEGWKALETSVRCVHAVLAGAGAAFAPHATRELTDLLYECLSHMNRFVREGAYAALEALCVALAGTPELPAHAVEYAERIVDGLSDNWSQVRARPARACGRLPAADPI